MDKKGFWALLASVSGSWRTVIRQLAATFRFRPAAGSANDDLPESNGRAVINTIYGNTVRWNQLLASGRLVDMGLPSGTLWATSNIDITQEDGFAASPFQYGCTMFSWGNVEGHNTPASGTTFNYDWGSVNTAKPWYDGQPYGSTPGAALIESIVAGDTQDAARYNLGSLFKMPTNTQFGELVDNCDFVQADGTTVIDDSVTDKRVTINDTVGIYLKSKVNGNLIFFSASGGGNGLSWYSCGDDGRYWSTSCSSPRDARFLLFNGNEVGSQRSTRRYLGFAVRAVVTPSTTSEIGHDNHKFCLTSNHKNMVDLTALEYPDIATTTPTVEEVEAWLALNVGEQDYYPYDEGSIISFKGTGIKSVGFNKFNKDDVINAYLDDDGEIVRFSSRRLGNYIRVLPNTAYYFGKAASSSTGINHAWYDVDKHIIGSPFRSYGANNSVITSPQNAYYLRCSVQGATTLDTFIVNISDAAKNGTYEPYREEITPIDPTKVYGKVNGEGSYVQCFPYGMNAVLKNSNGDNVNLKDTLTVDSATVRIGYQALKDIEWGASTISYIRRFRLLNNILYGRVAYFNATLVSPRYTLAVRGSSGADQEDLTIQLANIIITSSSNNWNYVKDSSEDNTVIRAAMDKSYIVYELDDYITYTNLIYSEDGGVTGTPLKELAYKVDKYSTEELLVPASEAGEPTSTAIIADIDYQKKG